MDDVSLVLMHQANKRINEYCQKALGLPDAKVIHNIERYGNTTAATIPLLWDEARAGRAHPAGRPRAAGRLRGGDGLGRDARPRLDRSTGRAGHLGCAVAASLGLQRDRREASGHSRASGAGGVGRKRLTERSTRKIAKATIRKLTIALMNRP